MLGKQELFNMFVCARAYDPISFCHTHKQLLWYWKFRNAYFSYNEHLLISLPYCLCHLNI